MLGFFECGDFLTGWGTVRLCRRTLLPGGVLLVCDNWICCHCWWQYCQNVGDAVV